MKLLICENVSIAGFVCLQVSPFGGDLEGASRWCCINNSSKKNCIHKKFTATQPECAEIWIIRYIDHPPVSNCINSNCSGIFYCIIIFPAYPAALQRFVLIVKWCGISVLSENAGPYDANSVIVGQWRGKWSTVHFPNACAAPMGLCGFIMH